MIHFIIQFTGFQLFFLLIYDLFLKKETFFNWNRFYLLVTPLLSFVIPFIKIDSLKGVVSSEYVNVLPEIILNASGNLEEQIAPAISELPWWLIMLIIGCIVSTVLFAYKLLALYKLKKRNNVTSYVGYSQVIIQKSNAAFSFFRTIFLGDQHLKKEHRHIIEHELVHIREKHSLDLLFFEVVRIVFWFNPLIYVYQNRISELHEFIADSRVVKIHKKEQYQALLSEVFKTEKISFINQFFNSSLIKKRIVMLQKSRSKKIWKLKYLLLVPLVMGMLIYTSCEKEEQLSETQQEALSLEQRLLQLEAAIKNKENMSDSERIRLQNILKEMLEEEKEIKDEVTVFGYKKPDGLVEEKEHVSFHAVDQVPVFPGCEDAEDKRACFLQRIQEHIRENFRYPEEAQEQGIDGRVSALFFIGDDGYVRDIRLRGPHEVLEAEVYNIFSKLPRMTPGRLDGKAVTVPFSIPVTFKLN
ncbi:energy transducer TonB [Leptobacterium flavescens]|uniref:Energy transducer TonB n=1 Tax=Leptobacterium flavescens TaxID=472055 RepID=A0A6P0ULJ6_9FLAO|nr:M56 family metallopeptidase [Leptobacterium flavescens]NER12788.1 energy transducer TonB [Leptobacterium flavescens]